MRRSHSIPLGTLETPPVRRNARSLSSVQTSQLRLPSEPAQVKAARKYHYNGRHAGRQDQESRAWPTQTATKHMRIDHHEGVDKRRHLTWEKTLRQSETDSPTEAPRSHPRREHPRMPDPQQQGLQAALQSTELNSYHTIDRDGDILVCHSGRRIEGGHSPATEAEFNDPFHYARHL